MALGYEGYVSLKVGAIEDAALGQGGSVPRARQRIESSSAYGGQIATPVTDIGIGLPRNYDWTVYDGSMSFDVHDDFVSNQLYPWVFNRQNASQVNIKTRNNNAQQFQKCYWNNINLSASEASPLAGSVSFVAMERNSYTRGGDYINNKTASDVLCVSSSPVFPLPFDLQNAPIPFWDTFVEIDGSLVEMTSWTLDFSQEVVKFFGCFGNSTPQEPKYVAVGPMTITFNGDYMFVDTATFSSPDTLGTLDITVGSTQWKLEDLELTTDTDDLQAQDSLTPVSIEYVAYTLVA
jgi:hypothetical protein